MSNVADSQARCEARTYVRDDRFGGWFNHCELPKGHRSQHQSPLNACEPKAVMRWSGTYTDKTFCEACPPEHQHRVHDGACLAGNGRDKPPLFCGCTGDGPKGR